MDFYSWAIPVLGYRARWKGGRRLSHKFFNTKAVANFGNY